MRGRQERKPACHGELASTTDLRVGPRLGTGCSRRCLVIRVAGEGLQELDQVDDLVRGELQRFNGRVQVGIADATLVVELNDRPQRTDTAIVHVRTSFSDVTKRRGFEFSLVRFLLCRIKESPVWWRFPPGNARVMESFVGKVRTTVAFPATGTTVKQPHALTLGIR